MITIYRRELFYFSSSSILITSSVNTHEILATIIYMTTTSVFTNQEWSPELYLDVMMYLLERLKQVVGKPSCFMSKGRGDEDLLTY